MAGANKRVDIHLVGGQLTFTDEHGLPADELHVEQGDNLRWCSQESGLIEFQFPHGHPFSPDPSSMTVPGCNRFVVVARPQPDNTKYNVILTQPGGHR